MRSRIHRRARLSRLTAGATVLAAGVVVLTAPPANAAITPVPGNDAGALTLADSISSQPGLVTDASWFEFPPGGFSANAVSDTALTSFPTAGGDYGIMTSGDATLADNPNDSESSGADVGGGGSRGNTAFDYSVLKVDLTVPIGDNCVGFDFRFLSEEFPEYVNTQYNDAFIAELDTTTWTTSGSNIDAPDNFAFDPAGNPISINAAGVTSMSSGESAGTTYDGATPQLNAQHAAPPGAHSLYLSIFDQGDHIYDSAVFVDNLHTFFDPQCDQGAEQTNEEIEGDVPAGGSMTTDETSNGATDADPIETTVTSPNAGHVSIQEGVESGTYPPPTGFYMLNVQSTVEAPDATDASNPIHVQFVIDSSKLPAGFDPDTMELLKDGSPVARCADPAATVAVPDPCFNAVIQGGGDLQVDVYTTTLSTFNFAVPLDVEPPAEQCEGHDATIVGSGTINGTSGDDVIVATGSGADTIRAGDGNDVVCAGPGDDAVYGGPGNDRLRGQAGEDHVRGQAGSDRAHGNDGNDRVLGNDGDDKVLGGLGNDKLLGGMGTDTCDGGPGTDTATTCETSSNVP